MAKGPTRGGRGGPRSKKHAYATGHRPHMSGGGIHDSRPARARTRAAAKSRALADQHY